MEIKRLEVGPLGTNCYIAFTEEEGRKVGVVIDPGAEAERILAFLRREEIRVEHILLTHVHFDHILAVPEVREATGADVLAPRGEEAAFGDPQLSLLQMDGREEFSLTADRLLDDGEEITAGPLRFTVMNTPGHTAGSCCYLAGEVIFSGDTLFDGDIGRTDFPGGSFELLRRSLQRLCDLPGDYRVLPGHGENTTRARERAVNPYMAR